jgi:hypothetical protein
MLSKNKKWIGGGTYGCWTLKAMTKYLTYMSAGDATIQPAPKGGYTVTDAHRPGGEWTGKTPKDAAIAAGFWVPENSNGY